jgi:hypothetical protein
MLYHKAFKRRVDTGLWIAAGSCEMYEFFVFFHEMHELSMYFTNCWRNLMKCANYWRNFMKCVNFQLIFFVYSGQNAIILTTLASQVYRHEKRLNNYKQKRMRKKIVDKKKLTAVLPWSQDKTLSLFHQTEINDNNIK